MGTHLARIKFQGLTKMDFENELLVVFFDTFKRAGIRLKQEPEFGGRGPHEVAAFVFVNGITGDCRYMYNGELNVLVVTFTKPKTAGMLSENEFASVVFDFIKNIASLETTGGQIGYSAYKLVKEAGDEDWVPGREVEWPEFEAHKPPRRSYM